MSLQPPEPTAEHSQSQVSNPPATLSTNTQSAPTKIADLWAAYRKGPASNMVLHDLKKETPNTEHATIMPCSETVAIRLSPQPHSHLYILDFISIVDGTRIETPPGIDVYRMSDDGRSKMWGRGYAKDGEPGVELYHLHRDFEYEICSAADGRLIMPLSWEVQYTPVPKRGATHAPH